jgi:hypothetical protein
LRYNQLMKYFFPYSYIRIRVINWLHVLSLDSPHGGVYKINLNVAIEKFRKMMGVSVITRDNEGEVLATMHNSQAYIIDLW